MRRLLVCLLCACGTTDFSAPVDAGTGDSAPTSDGGGTSSDGAGGTDAGGAFCPGSFTDCWDFEDGVVQNPSNRNGTAVVDTTTSVSPTHSLHAATQAMSNASGGASAYAKKILPQIPPADLTVSFALLVDDVPSSHGELVAYEADANNGADYYQIVFIIDAGAMRLRETVRQNNANTLVNDGHSVDGPKPGAWTRYELHVTLAGFPGPNPSGQLEASVNGVKQQTFALSPPKSWTPQASGVELGLTWVASAGALAAQSIHLDDVGFLVK